MLKYLLWAAVAWVAVQVASTFSSWRRNVVTAKASGIPYFTVPVFLLNPINLLLYRPFLLRFLRKLPLSWTAPWRELISPMHSWDHLYSDFEKLGTDTYLTAAPGALMLWTCSADVVSQITTRRNDFPKPVHLYESLNLFGGNVVSSEGQSWRHQRKIVTPPFTEKNNHLVWMESIHQVRAMMKSWTGEDGNDAKTITSAPEDTMRLSLHVIARAGFGQRLLWPGVETPKQSKATKGLQSDIENGIISPGHELSYVEALHTVLENLYLLVGAGRLLKYFPSDHAKRVHRSFIEWRKYMTDLLEEKKEEIKSGGSGAGLDLLGAMIRSANSDDVDDSKTPFGDEEVLGNAFIFTLAGHETSANTIHFSLVYLACYPEVHRRLQEDVDSIFQGRGPEEWDYEKDLPKLFGSTVGATMSEVLRLIPPVLEIPKCAQTAQPLIINGKKCMVPAGTLINLDTAAAHRNPNYWPHGSPSDPQGPIHPESNLDNDLEEFKPERWLMNGNYRPQQSPRVGSTQTGNVARAPEMAGNDGDEDDEDGTGGPTKETASLLYKPVKGSYLPFSDGGRSCLGRRFAQVEVLAVLAFIFSQWNVELALDDFIAEKGEGMTEEEREAAWWKARERALFVFRKRMQARVTLKMEGKTNTPMRFVKRVKA